MPDPFSRCRIVPLPDQQVAFEVDGGEKLLWHFGGQSPRPFFYPLTGPSGTPLTRMGHPGAGNHDHHRSVWFAHNDVEGVNFWSDRTKGRIRQKFWYAYQDGNKEAVMASTCGWYDGDGVELMQHDLVAAIIPMNKGEHALEIQITLRPPEKKESVKLGKTNFGFLSVRVAKTVSVFFGDGVLSNSEGQKDEPNIFGKQARWMDYSGPIAVGLGESRKTVVEGITYFDHPKNPRYPTFWHVREDGWMGASFCMQEGYTIRADAPLTLRYLLHAHRGAYDQTKAESIHEGFAKRPGFEFVKDKQKHRQYGVKRSQ